MNIKEVPEGLTLLQRTNGKASYAVDLKTGWLYEKHVSGGWVTVRKLSAIEIMQAEDQELYGEVINQTTVRA